MESEAFYYMEEYVNSDGELKLLQHHRRGTRIIDAPFKPYCYVRSRKKDDLGFKDATTNERVTKKEFVLPDQLAEMAWSNQSSFEADVSYVHRVMLDEDLKISDVPKAWVDIEVDDSEGAPDSKKHEITAIGIIFDNGKEVFLSTIGKTDYNEYNMLDDFMQMMRNVGAIITYNGGEDVWETRSFDMPYLATRYGIVIEGMAEEDESVKQPFNKKMKHCAFLDMYQIYKYETSRVGKSIAGGYSLENVAQTELGRGKIKHDGKFSDMSDEDMRAYNMRDVELLRDIDIKFSFSDLKIKLAQLTHICLTAWKNNKKRKELSPLVMADQLIIEYSKSKKMVWPTNKYNSEAANYKGAFVFAPTVGIHYTVQNYDVKQMYPNIIIHERISPDKDRVIIPEILINLTRMRKELKDKYKISKSKEDYITQYNYKVLANVIYGAFGSPASRYFSQALAGAVTAKGRNLLEQIKRICEDHLFEVIYGDTDSVFVKIEKSKVPIMERIINRAITPYEVEAGDFYMSILYTGDETGGNKKRYAGLLEDGNMTITGLESIKRDYCILSRETQMWALGKILTGYDTESISKCLRNLYKAMLKGTYDNYLVLTKGTKKLEEYATKTKSGRPTRGLPHIRALKMAYEKGHKSMFDISFMYTTDDVEPVFEDEPLPKNINYALYFDKQIRGVVDPLIKAIQVQDGTYLTKRGSKKTTINESLFDHMSS